MVFEEPSAVDRPSPRPHRSPGRVLLAEDDPDTRTAIMEALADVGYDVIALEDGTQVIECLGIFARDGLRAPDLLALDVYMPGATGIELLEGIRRTGWMMPVVLMTAYGSNDLRERADQAGLAVVLEKPFELPNLCALTRRMLTGTRAIRIERPVLAEEPVDGLRLPFAPYARKV